MMPGGVVGYASEHRDCKGAGLCAQVVERAIAGVGHVIVDMGRFPNSRSVAASGSEAGCGRSRSLRMPVDIVASLKAAASVSAFLSGPQFLDAMADVGMSATRTAMQRAASARDRRAFVLSAVNHLEGVEAAMKHQLERWGGAIRYTAPTKESNVRCKYKRVLCLLASCYHYLGEPKLAAQALDEAVAADARAGPGWANPINVVDYLSPDHYLKLYIDVQEYRKVLFGTPLNDLPTTELS